VRKLIIAVEIHPYFVESVFDDDGSGVRSVYW
jgi:hypothetical protein